MDIYNGSNSHQPIKLEESEWTELSFKRELRKGDEIVLTLKKAKIGDVVMSLMTITLEQKSNLRFLNSTFYADLDFEYNEYRFLEPHGKVIHLQNIKLIRVEVTFSRKDILFAVVLPFSQK